MEPAIEGTVVGGVFTADVPGGRAAAQVSVDEKGVHAIVLTSGSGEPAGTFLIESSSCTLTQGGASGRMIFCHNADRSITIFSEERNFRGLLAQGSGGKLTPHLTRLDEVNQSARKRTWRLGAMVVGGLAVVLGVGYVGLRWAASSALSAIPQSVDRQIGELVMDASPPEGRTVDDEVVVDAIETIVTRLEGPLEEHIGRDFDFRVHVVESATVNAFALPGGNIVVFTGLLREAESVEQVAGVIGHEMAHVSRRHGVHSVIEALGFLGVCELALGDLSGIAALTANALELTALSSHNRQRESEADLDAVYSMNAAGLDPVGLADFFAQLAEDKGDIPAILAWQASHPAHKERITAIHLAISELQPHERIPLGIDWDNVRKHVTPASKADQSKE